MILKVNKDICEIKQNEVWNVGDYNVHTVQVELSDEFDGLVNKVRYFVEDNSYDMLITDNVAQVPYEATLTEGTIKIGVYGYDVDTNILVQSTSPVNKYISSGTYKGEADNTEPLTPTDKQQMESAIQKNTDDITDLQNNKQDLLISGENIKTINNESILGTGNIEIDVGSINYNDLTNKPSINNVELSGNKSLHELGIQSEGNYATVNDLDTKQNTLISGTNIKTINNNSILGSGNIDIQGGTFDYTDLTNKPKINNVILSGNKSLNDLGIQPVGNYALESEIPDVSNFITNSVNNLLNYYLKSETYTKQEVNNLIGQIATLQFQVVSTLPQTGDSKYIYLVPSSNPKTQNVKDEYIWANNAWEQIGSTQVDLTGYATESWVNTQISGFLTQSQIQALINTALSDYALERDMTEAQNNIEALQTENERLKATLPTTTGEGQDITLDKTAEMEFVKPPLPRGNTKQNTTTGKNLLNTSNANTTTVNGVTSYRNNGFYYLSGTNTKTDATWVLPNTQNTNLPVFEIGQTYTMSFKGTMPNGIYAQLNAVKASTGTQYNIGSVRNTVPSLTFTIDSDYSRTAQLFIGVQGVTTNADCNFAIQIEKGPTATSYEPYTGGIPSPNPGYPQEVEVVTGNVEVTISNNDNSESKTLPLSLGNIELCEIGNYQDYLYKNNGKWYKYNAINKLVFNGSENWNYNAQNNVAYLQLTTKVSSRKGLFSNLFNYYNADWTNAPDNTISEAVSSNFIFIKSTVASNISTWKSWLSTHNTIVYYVLATPTSTEITDVTLISQLEEISKTLSYQGQTNITSNTIALFDVEAYQSTKLILENLDSRLTLVEG